MVEGLIAPGTKLKYKIIFDGGRISGRDVVIDADDEKVTGKAAINTLGSFKLGEQVIGGVMGDVEGLRPFRAIIECPTTNFFDIQIERKCDTLGGDYIIYYEAPVDVTEYYDLTSNL